MKRFNANDGYLHFLFANEDDYYLDSLVHLDLKQYLYYCLKKEHYRCICFLGGSKNGVQVSVLDSGSVEEFAKSDEKGLFKPHAQRRMVVEHGHELCEISLQGEDDWHERLKRLLRGKQDACAFIVPIRLFFELFLDGSRQQSLLELVKNERQKSIFIILASSHADASMDYLLDRSGPFCSKLCPEVLRVTGKAKKVLLYEEMAQELGGRYQIFNQLEQQDILHMLEYGALIEQNGWPCNPEVLQDMADFIYFWYHSPLFAASQPGLFPENEEHLLSVIFRALDSPERWQKCVGQIARLREGWPSGMLLRKILEPDYPVIRRFHPRREQSSLMRRLQHFSVSSLTGEEGTARCRQLSSRFLNIQENLQRVYSDSMLQREDKWLEFCIDSLQRMKAYGYQDADAVERIVNFLDYLIVQDERVRFPELFEEKAEYYRKIIELFLEIISIKNACREQEEQLHENRIKMQEKIEEIHRLEQESPEIQGETEKVLLGEQSYSGAYLSIAAEKEEVVHLNGDCKNLQRLIAGKKSKINSYLKAVRQLELSIDELSGGNLTGLSDTMRSAANSMQRKSIAHERFQQELEGAMEECQAVQEEMQVPEQVWSNEAITKEFIKIANDMKQTM